VDGDAGAREAEPEEDEQEVALDFRLLRYFVAVAEELHLARAAERLGIEQSPVSRAMRDLESQLGVQLFDRSTRLTRLTWAGQVFLGECRRVMATVEQAVKSAKAAAQGYQGHLRIAFPSPAPAPDPHRDCASCSGPALPWLALDRDCASCSGPALPSGCFACSCTT
jgi:DNA-binding transcriptional LysR family regulator